MIAQIILSDLISLLRHGCMLDHANYPQELRYIESILFVALFESNMNITMYGFFLALHFKGTCSRTIVNFYVIETFYKGRL